MPNPFAFDEQAVLQNASKATTEDLIDRITVYREGMEPRAIELIETELRRRGVSKEDIDKQAQRNADAVILPDGFAATCNFCRQPAVVERWGWQRLLRILPLFPRKMYYCKDHMPR